METQEIVKMEESTLTDAAKQQPVLLDSLPYVDILDDEWEQRALTLIEQEMQSTQPSRLPPLPHVVCRTGVMKEAWESLLKGERKPLSDPPNFHQMSEAVPPKQNTAVAWLEAVRQARIEYESERLRAMVLEVTKGDQLPEAWKAYNRHLESIAKDLQEQLQQQRATVNQIHIQRQQEQERFGQQLQRLGRQRQDLLEKKRLLQKATQELESELTVIRSEVDGV
jgi:hypothetical protein